MTFAERHPYHVYRANGEFDSAFSNWITAAKTALARGPLAVVRAFGREVVVTRVMDRSEEMPLIGAAMKEKP